MEADHQLSDMMKEVACSENGKDSSNSYSHVSELVWVVRVWLHVEIQKIQI